MVGVLPEARVPYRHVLALMGEHDTQHHADSPTEALCSVCLSEPAWDGPMTLGPIGAPAPIAGLCLGCALWAAAVKARFATGRLLDRDATGAPTARIDGRLYVMQPDPPPGKITMRGFGGRKFEIRYFSGKSIVGANPSDCRAHPA